jgi:GNAT superfamily N-acetyltransferase
MVSYSGHTIKEFAMKVYADALDQNLLCIHYDFSADCPINRETALACFEPGVKQKIWWRYYHTYLGLQTLVAYEGFRPVGHIEFMPIEHAPRSIVGQDLTVINCLYVAKTYRGRGIGRELIDAAEHQVQTVSTGVGVLAYQDGEFMPKGYFEHVGFSCVDERDDKCLLVKQSQKAIPPSILPVRYQPRETIDALAVDFFLPHQCPYLGWAGERLRRAVRKLPYRVDLQLIEITDRPAIIRWGIAQGLFINGHEEPDFHPWTTTPKKIIDRLNMLSSRLN